jgi:predicted DNA-binding transcriptional regulator
LQYVFLNGDREASVIISDKLSNDETRRLVTTLEKYRSVIGYSLKDLKGIIPSLCTHRISMQQDHKPIREHQRQLNNVMREVVKKKVLKLLKAGVIYHISDSEWVGPVQVVLKKGGMAIIRIEKNELILQWTVTGWRMCIDYCKLNKATQKDHSLLPLIYEMLERLANHSFCYLDGYFGYHQIPIHPDDQSKTTFIGLRDLNNVVTPRLGFPFFKISKINNFKGIYLPPTYLHFIQDIEDMCLLLTSSTSFVDLPFQEHRMTEKHHMDQNPCISSLCPK